MPWYAGTTNAVNFGFLFRKVGAMFTDTVDSVYSYEQTDVLAVFFSAVIFAVVAAVFFYFWRNTKK